MRIKTFIFIFGILIIFSSIALASQRPVELIPQRIILEDREKSTVLRVINRNPKPATYRIETIILEQNLLGGIEKIKEPTPEQEEIMKMIRFSPRQVRVPPNSIQTVRIMARKPANLPPGEYRVHLQVNPIPDPQEDSGPGEKGVAVKIDLLISVSIPIIIRHGKTMVDLDFKDPEILHKPDGSKSLKLYLLAKGNRSVYLDAEIYQGEILVGQSRGFAIYQPNGQREMVFPLKKLPLNNKFRLILRDREKDDNPLIKEIPILLK